MMPLCTTATVSRDAIGCALTVFGAPCVAQRVCAMPGEARDRLARVQLLELAHLALRAHAFEPLVGQQGDARGIVAAILERLETGDERADDIAPSSGADDSTHEAIPRRAKKPFYAYRVSGARGRDRSHSGALGEVVRWPADRPAPIRSM